MAKYKQIVRKTNDFIQVGVWFMVLVALLLAFLPLSQINAQSSNVTPAVTSVPGQNYEICDETSQYLTSPWTYDALASGQQTYTVAQYEALAGYGTTLPSLPSYISSESSTATAAEIFAPGSTAVDSPAYDFPGTPMIYFFEGGAYGPIDLQSISGDEFIGGSAPSYPEPVFDDGGAADGISEQNNSYNFTGGSSTLAASAAIGATTITTTTAIPGYLSYVTFSDGSTYGVSSSSGTSITLSSSLTSAEAAGSEVWGNDNGPVAYISASATQGATSVTLTSSSAVLVKYGEIVIGSDSYQLTSVSGSQSGYTAGVAGLDMNVSANTPVYYNYPAGGVTVEYLNINNDQHDTTGTITVGAGWTVEHNNIHDGNSKGPGYGVAIYGGDESTIEYNCLSKMGDYGMANGGLNMVFDYNEVFQGGYNADPGCGCSGGGKWWHTLNDDIVDNAFVENGIGSGQPAIWMDDGNTGMLIEGNYFYRNAGASVDNETGYNMEVENNLFLDDGWETGTGQASNDDGAVEINSSGGMNIPGSRYENEILVSGNQFINDWEGLTIWQSGERSCENSGEGWPDDAPYCSGGFPTTNTTAAGDQYYFSHINDSAYGGSGTTLQMNAASGSTTVLVNGNMAIDDQIGFSDPVSTTTTDTTSVSSFTGSGTVTVASTGGFPSSGQLRVGTSAAWSDGNGSYTGAILSYTGTTSTTFTGVSLVRGTGTLSGPILQVQPYKVTAETCYANDCALTVSPALTSAVATGATVTNAGTCQLYATSAALPSGPLAPNGASYWDGCQWGVRDVSVTGNTFVSQPSLISASTPPEGTATSTSCTAANNCGTNFMAYQVSGENPFDNQIGANAMFSSSSFTGCPSWDSGCTSSPLSNINALSNPPGAPAGNGEAPDNDVWSSNTYFGPWNWNAYIYGNCSGGGIGMPTDSTTGKTMPTSDCGNIGYSPWNAALQQDGGSTNNPMVVTFNNGLTSGQEIYGPAQGVSAYEDGGTAGSVTSSLLVNGSTASTISSAPYNFSLNTLNYTDGAYTIKVSGQDSGGNTNSDSTSVYISNGDLNSDGKVNISDLAILAAHYGATSGANYSDGSIQENGKVNISDLAILAANWGWVKP